jgi:chemotaxis signal transduction protein
MVNPAVNHIPTAWCLFRSQSRALAVPLDRVSEIVAVDRLVRVPLSPPELLGLCTVRREVIAVLRLDTEASQAGGQETRPTAVLVLRGDQGRPWGIGINRDGITVLDETPADEEGNLLDPEARTPPDVIRRGDDVYTVVHPDKAWAVVRAAVERWYRISCPEDSSNLVELAR